MTVHRVIALTFLGPRPSGFDINHKNGIKDDNRAENLEYCTKSENAKHSFRIGAQDNKGVHHSQARLSDDDVITIRRMVRSGIKQCEVAALFGVHPSNVSRISRGEFWPHIPLQVEGGVR